VPLSRLEAYSKWGLLREIEPLTDSAYAFFEWLEQQKPNIGEAAEHHWHTSFHGSSFPGDNPYACGRKALYTLMDIPRGGFNRRSRAVMEAGKDIENRIVLKWYLAGYLVSSPPPPYSDWQTEFQDKDHWLSSTVDAIVIHPKQTKPKVVEIKSKYADDIDQMLKLCRGPDPAHVFQIKCQIGLAYEQGPWPVERCYNTGRLAVTLGHRGDKPVVVCPEHGTGKCLQPEILEPVDYGFLYYVSRDKPDDTWEFLVEYDPEFMEAGRQKLREWKKWWKKRRLPQTEFSDKRFSHPFGWYWSKAEYPCKWCDYGDICREDHKAAVKQGKAIRLDNSTGNIVARELRADYDLDLVRQALNKRWGEEETRSDKIKTAAKTPST
jgi:hypothetical protein